MECISPIVCPVFNIFSSLWTCFAHRADYFRKLQQNLNTLESSLNSLRCKRDEVTRRIEMAEASPMEPAKRTKVVSDWLQGVQVLEIDVQKIIDDNQVIRNVGGCWRAYQLGNLMSQKQIVMESSLRDGDFQDVTDRCQPNLLQRSPTFEVVGMDAKFNEVMASLVTEGNHEKIVGLYGMGGVGKTTLLHKVDNELAKRKHFDLAIWTVMSKDQNIKSIQNQIGKKVGLSWTEDTELRVRANDIFQVLKNKKFLLLSDDIWEGVDLETIGVSKNTLIMTGSKVVFTTRSEQVCESMEADKRIKIECLEENQAWSLFQQMVMQEALSCHPDIPEVAKEVAKECYGLPLALITIGRTMSRKTDLQQWKHALHTLRESASQFSGMADKALAILKFSYDNLESQKLKSCFLHCSLQPKDSSFAKDGIILVWVVEGFLDNVDDFAKAENEGLDVIRRLQDACLLETGIMFGLKMEGFLKMHDVVRDLAIWIASDPGRETYLILQAKSTLELHEWEKAERISLKDNATIKELNGAPQCSNLLALNLRGSSISVVSDDFFRFMPMLKFLFMHNVKLKNQPSSMFALTELQYLYLPEYDEGVILTPGGLASLTNLKILCLSESCCHWDVEDGPSLNELESLQHLIYLQITIGTGLALQRLVTSQRLQCCKKFLTIKYCPGMTSLTLLPSLPSSPVSFPNLVHMIGLRNLILKNCDELEELRIMSLDEDTLFTTLESLYLFDMPKLRIVLDVPRQSFCFVNLKYVIIRGCPHLKDISWMIYAQNLEVLFLIGLDGLEEIISDGFATEAKLINTFSRLVVLGLYSLRNLKRVCDHSVKFSHMEKISVVGCPELKKLPFNTNSVIPQALKKIEGNKQWWEKIEWEDEATKSNLSSYFRDVRY